jgi:hypothetical protein
LGVWVASFVSWVFVGGLPLGFWLFLIKSTYLSKKKKDELKQVEMKREN